jgi:hypothetical protein
VTTTRSSPAETETTLWRGAAAPILAGKMMIFVRRVLLVAVLLAACATGPALATDYCVSPATGCGFGNNYIASGAGLQSALNAAVGPSDRVLLGAATYVAPTTSGFTYNHQTLAPEIVGAGSGQTILTGPQDTLTVLTFRPGAAGVLRDVGIKIPLRVAAGSFLAALYLSGGTARRVAITSDPALNGANALELNGGVFEDGSLTLPTSGPIAAVGTLGPGGTVRDTTIVASAPLNVTDDNFTAERVRATAGPGRDALSVRGVNARVSDSVLIQPGTASAVTISTGNGTNPTLRLDHDTIVGTGAGGSTTGLYADSTIAGFAASLDVHDTIIRGFAHARSRGLGGAGTGATITTSYSDYDPSGDQVLGTPAGSTGSLTPFPGPGDVNVDPRFVDLAGGDYRLRADSPLVDAGDPAAPFALEPATDLLGRGRSLDGTRDCVARTDLGAFELHDVPTARATRAASAIAGEPIAFDGSTSCDPDGDALTYVWSFDDGATATGAQVQHAFAAAGPHTATLTATDAGAEAGSTTLSFEVAPAAVAGVPQTLPSVPSGIPLPPRVLSGLRAAPSSFAVRKGKRGGTVLRFTLSAAATLKLALTREVAGHRSGARCVAGAPGRGSKAKRCTALRGAGSVTLHGRAGANAIAFTGKVGKRALAVGRYHATATAHGFAVARCTFRIVRAR